MTHLLIPSVLGMAFVFAAPVCGQSSRKDKSPIIVYTVRHAEAFTLAKILSLHFTDDAFAVAEPSGNSLLIRARNSAIQREVLSLLERIDRAPKTIGVGLLLVEIRPDLSRNPSRNPPAVPDAKELSGSPEKVRAYLAKLKDNGNFVTTRQLHLCALENRTTTSSDSAEKPMVTGITATANRFGGRGGRGAGLPAPPQPAPQVVSSVTYRAVGTVFAVTPQLIGNDQIQLTLNFEDSQIKTQTDGAQLGVDGAGVPIRPSETPVTSFNTRVTVPAGQAVLVKGFHKIAGPVRSDLFMIITARVAEPRRTR